MNQLRIAPEHNNRAQPFRVAAGKLEGPEQERNFKYCESFSHLDDAHAASRACAGYHFVDLEYVDEQGLVWSIDLLPVSA